MEQRQKSN